LIRSLITRCFGAGPFGGEIVGSLESGPLDGVATVVWVGVVLVAAGTVVTVVLVGPSPGASMMPLTLTLDPHAAIASVAAVAARAVIADLEVIALRA
jgi:hypothetical protein